MIATTSEFLDLAFSILIVAIAAQWAAQRAGGAVAVLFACAVGAVYSVVSDFSISYLVADYDRSLNAVTINASLGAPIDLAIAYLATRRRRPLALA